MANKKTDAGQVGSKAETPAVGTETGTALVTETAGMETGNNTGGAIASVETETENGTDTGEIVVSVELGDSADKDKEALKTSVEARRIMQATGVKKAWRCPRKGYWFTRQDYAENHARKFNVTLKSFEWED